MSGKYQHAAVALLWICGVGLTAHLLYSRLGFNPTDDGFTLAYSRRLLDGQVPHRDFVTIRPALSPALHVPEVLFGGQYVFWLSRLVFFLQFACIAWYGVRLVNDGLGPPLSHVEQSSVAVVAFAFCCHSFPAMAWHTVDGLFLCILGLRCRSRPSSSAAVAGYLLMGAAYLCKQSFLFVAPGALLIFGEWRRWRCVVAAVLPGALYGVYLLASGAVSDAAPQLLAQTGIMQTGVQSFLNWRCALGLGTGLALSWLLCGNSDASRGDGLGLRVALGLGLTAVAVGLATRSLFVNGLKSSSFTLFGLVCGVVTCLGVAGGKVQACGLKVGAVIALLAWSVSLSLGYNSPVLASGILLAFLMTISCRRLSSCAGRWRVVLSCFLALLVAVVFHHTRVHHIYREQSASRLTASVGEVLPGARLIRTNPNTHAFLLDLNTAISNVTNLGMEYSIVPEVAAHWVRSEQRNPLPVDWAQGIELGTADLVDRVVAVIEQRRSRQIVIVQKVRAATLPAGFVELRPSGDYYALVAYVRTHLEKASETKYFDLYR